MLNWIQLSTLEATAKRAIDKPDKWETWAIGYVDKIGGVGPLNARVISRWQNGSGRFITLGITIPNNPGRVDVTVQAPPNPIFWWPFDKKVKFNIGARTFNDLASAIYSLHKYGS